MRQERRKRRRKMNELLFRLPNPGGLGLSLSATLGMNTWAHLCFSLKIHFFFSCWTLEDPSWSLIILKGHRCSHRTMKTKGWCQSQVLFSPKINNNPMGFGNKENGVPKPTERTDLCYSMFNRWWTRKIRLNVHSHTALVTQIVCSSSLPPLPPHHIFLWC